MSAMPTVTMTLATDPTLPAFFLGRMAELADEQARATDPKVRVVLSIALFSAFLDCADLGLHEEAQRIMAGCQRQAIVPVDVAA